MNWLIKVSAPQVSALGPDWRVPADSRRHRVGCRAVRSKRGHARVSTEGVGNGVLRRRVAAISIPELLSHPFLTGLLSDRHPIGLWFVVGLGSAAGLRKVALLIQRP
jgi:hypothetical protein